jgi:hypothetical protein
MAVVISPPNLQSLRARAPVQEPHGAISASFDRRSEDVRVLPIIIAELEFGNVQRHIFSAHFVERADYAALENRPKAFDGLSVDSADDVLAPRMVNSHVWIIPIERIVAGIDQCKASCLYGRRLRERTR